MFILEKLDGHLGRVLKVIGNNQHGIIFLISTITLTIHKSLLKRLSS